MDTVVRINNVINDFAWGSFGLALLMATGILCTLANRFLQLAHCKHWFKSTFLSLRGKGTAKHEQQTKGVPS